MSGTTCRYGDYVGCSFVRSPMLSVAGSASASFSHVLVIHCNHSWLRDCVDHSLAVCLGHVVLAHHPASLAFREAFGVDNVLPDAYLKLREISPWESDCSLCSAE